MPITYFFVIHTAYGYHHLTDEPLSMTADANGLEHTNRKRYTAAYLAPPTGICRA